MPIHDWTRVQADIFNAFHHHWISTISDALNSGLLPSRHYALIQKENIRHLGKIGIDPNTRKASNIGIRRVSDDSLVAKVDIVSPPIKLSKSAFHEFVENACNLLELRIHMLVVDLIPPTTRVPLGIHAALWERFADAEFTGPEDKPLTLVAYESVLQVNAFVEPVAVGEPMPDMPLFLESGAYIAVSLEKTYQDAWGKFPQRWRRELEEK